MTDRELLEKIFSELQGLKSDVSSLKGDVSSLKCDVDSLKGDIKSIKAIQEEDHIILKALEHKAEINKSEHDNMANNINHIMGDVEALRKYMSNVEVITSSNWADIAKLKAVK